MKWILYAVAALVIAIVALLVFGWTRPRSHVARGRVTYGQSPEQVWQALTEFEAWPDWNSNVTSMERRPDSQGKPVWSFSGKWGDMPSRIEVLEPPGRMVTQILEDADLGFSGSWEYQIEPVDGGSSLTITERGAVDNVLFRAMSIFRDHHAAMRQCMTDLGRHFGETVTMEIVERAPTEPETVESGIET